LCVCGVNSFEPYFYRPRNYCKGLRQEINKMGGLFPGKSPEEVIEILRQTRKEIYEEKYAPSKLFFQKEKFDQKK